jgi:methionyl-tRNA formyltransferase
MGTSTFAVPSLEALIADKHDILAVITQPDRKRGRGKKVLPSPVKEIATKYNKTIYQPQKINSAEAWEFISKNPVDLIVVVSYGQIIPERILDYPRYGCINVHASLLPAYRGAAPIQRAIMQGEKQTGITIMFMDKGLDTGDIILQESVDIPIDIEHGELEEQLARSGAALLCKAIQLIATDNNDRLKQDDRLSSYADRLCAEEEKIDWTDSAINIHNKIRAFSPSPGAYTFEGGKRLKLFKSSVVKFKATGQVGEIIAINNDNIVIQTGEECVAIKEVQKEGKKRIPVEEFLKGSKINKGTILSKTEN